jgi:hypothetical protein
VRLRMLHGDRELPHCQRMLTFTDLASVPSRPLAPLTEVSNDSCSSRSRRNSGLRSSFFSHERTRRAAVCAELGLVGISPSRRTSDERPVDRHPTGGRDALDVGHLLGRPTFLVVLPEPPENGVVGGEEPFDLCATIVAGIRVCHRSFPRRVASDSIVFRGPSRQPIGMQRRPRSERPHMHDRASGRIAVAPPVTSVALPRKRHGCSFFTSRFRGNAFQPLLPLLVIRQG